MGNIWLPGNENKECRRKLGENWFFPVSALAFFCLTADNTVGYALGLPVVGIIMAWLAASFGSFRHFAATQPKRRRVFCGINALCICFANLEHFFQMTQKLPLTGGFEPLFLGLSCFGGAAALWFVFLWQLVFWGEMERILWSSALFRDVGKGELAVYLALFCLLAGLTAAAFFQTEVFYGTTRAYDLVYTSDSPSLVKDNAYLVLTHLENDLRQPLFGVFSGPFLGVPYLLGRLLDLRFQAVLMDWVQIAMLLGGNFALAKTMGLAGTRRLCFMLLLSCTYSQLLAVLMMEQYIVAYFWLMLCLYRTRERGEPERILLWGAGGTLLTSLMVLPFLTEGPPGQRIRKTGKRSLEFVGLMLAFARFDVLFHLVGKIRILGTLAGKPVPLETRLWQYTAFLHSCFAAPAAGVSHRFGDQVSWQLAEPQGISAAGAIILLLSVISAWIPRKEAGSRMAAGWAAFSVGMLLLFGWGTVENGLILYSLYFGWAFFALLFQLGEMAAEKLGCPLLVPLLSILWGGRLLWENLPAIWQLVQFGITHYPAS